MSLGHLCEQGALNGPVALFVIVLTLLVCSEDEAAMFHIRTYVHAVTERGPNSTHVFMGKSSNLCQSMYVCMYVC